MNSFSIVKFLRFLRKGDLQMFDVPQKVQQAYLESLPAPENDIQRSLNQFKCQCFFWTKWKVPLFNVVSLFVFFPALLLEWIRSLWIRPCNHYDALSELKGMKEVVSEEVSSEYDIMFADWLVKGMLRSSDLGFVMEVFLASFPNTYFALKILLRVSQYSEVIYLYSPRAIVTHGEFSFASSALTHYCDLRGVSHINVMHGEKLYHIYDSFFRFDKCYVWSEFYERLFLKMRAYEGQFVVRVPPSMKIDSEAHKNVESYADYKYYLANFDDAEIASVVRSMEKLKKSGKSVRYRLHPRYLNLDLISKHTTADEIENPREVSILESVANCACAVGSYSTVLAQAYMSGKQVVMDDVTYKDRYEKLAEYDYWLASENCQRLSQL